MHPLKNRTHPYSTILFCCAFLVLVLCMLYMKDNHRNEAVPHPENGHLTVTKEDCEGLTFFSLSTGWDQMDEHTYCLTVDFPRQPHSYTLYFEDYLSSYEVYVNDSLLSLGELAKYGSFEHSITSAQFTFTAAGSSSIRIVRPTLLSYQEELSFSPILGLTGNINLFHFIQVLCTIVFIVVLLIMMSIAAYIFMIEKTLRSTLVFYELLCFGLLLHISPRFLYAIYALPVDGWYLWKSMVGIISCLIGVFLVDAVRKIPFRKTCFQGAFVLVLFFLTAVFYMSALLAPSFHTYCYNVLPVFRIACAVYIFGSSLRAYRYHEQYGEFLLLGSALMLTAGISRHVFADYEPLYGFYFFNYGAFLYLLCFGIAITSSVLLPHRERFIMQEERRLLSSQLDMQKMHYQELTEKIEDAIRIRHDQRHLIQMISSLLKEEKYEELTHYLDSYTIYSPVNEHVLHCRNWIVDAILNYYDHLCKEKQIALDLSVALPSTLPIPDIDLSILFSNILENAFEACIKQTPKEASIQVTSRYANETLLLRVTNTFATKPVILENEQFLSSKHEGNGVGTQSIARTVRQYDGHLAYHITDTQFQISISITCSNLL